MLPGYVEGGVVILPYKKEAAGYKGVEFRV